MTELVRCDDPSRWAGAISAAVAAGRPATPFHTFRFLRLVAPMIGHEFRGFVVRDGGTDVGVLPWLTQRRGPVTVVNRTPFPYVGPLVPAELLPATLAASRRIARRQRAVIEEHQFAPGTTIDASVAAAHGFELSLDRTFVVDTSRDTDTLFAAMTSRTRSLVRKAAAGGITVAESAAAHSVLADIEREIYAGKHLPAPYGPPFPPTLGALTGDDLDDGLEPHWTIATLDGEPVATLLTLRRGDTSGIWVGGVFGAHRKSAANVALVWDAMSWAHEHGVRHFDFVGLPDPGIETFKKQFGGELVTYPVLRRSSRVWRAGQRLAVSAQERLRALKDRR